MDEEKKTQRERNAANNTQNVRNAADVAMASGNPYAMAAGAAVKGADKITGGKASEAIGSGLEKAGRVAPGGQALQNLSNKTSESGLGDLAGQGARMYNGMKGGGPNSKPGEGSELAKQPTGTNTDTIRRGQDVPSSNANNGQGASATDSDSDGEERKGIAGLGPFTRRKSSFGQNSNSQNEQNQDSDYNLDVFGGSTKRILIISVVAFLPVIILIIVFAIIAASSESGFEDALGATSAAGEELGDGMFSDYGDENAKAYYERINNVKLEYQAQGKSFDVLDVAAVFHVLMDNGANIEYKDISESRIREVADSMFNNGTYDKEYFKDRLKVKIIPKYLPRKNDDEIDVIADEIDVYIADFNDYVERSVESSLGSSCGSLGSCTYNIKGFYVNNRNISKQMEITNLKVRLMQCGSPYGNGSYNTPINQDLVDFEEYAGGVAYAEIGDGQPLEAYKAQLVMARSFALSRPAAMGNSAGKKLAQENGQWILQISSCVADQVFCNINKGCSYMGGGDGQGGWVASGTNVSGAVKTRAPLSGDADLRKAMTATQGEVLVNSQGNVMVTGYKASDQNNIISMAKSGMDYKQILLKKYAGSGAKNIEKMSCNSSGGGCQSTGEFANWKQCGATWSSVPMGSSGSNICGIGCLVTSVSMLIAKSGTETTISNFNPGTFVQYLNSHGGFQGGGNFVWASATGVAPKFKYQNQIYVLGWSRQQKLEKIKSLLAEGAYITCEVKGNTGQHWVAVDSVNGDQITMMDPGSSATNMWQQYPWGNTSTIAYYKVG